MPIASAFEVMVPEDKTAPVVVMLRNDSYGADEYEWTFEGGVPATSKDKTPERVTFAQAGEHTIRLRVRNAVEERVSEQKIRVDSTMTIDFDYTVELNDIAPGTISIVNRSRGGSAYEWTFEDGEPRSSNAFSPGPTVFARGGVHRIALKVSNGSKSIDLSKTFTMQAPMAVAFAIEPRLVDQDWEAPLILQTTNHTTGGLTYRWACQGAEVSAPEATEGTSIRFDRAGFYTLQLIARNGKEEKTESKTIVVRPNSGIISHQDLHFGINEAKNSLGCFYASRWGGVLTSDRITREGLGQWVDFGFFALNSSFGYCYFFSPTEARANAFPQISGATASTTVNSGVILDDATFERLVTASDLDQFSRWSEPRQTHFTKDNLPHFALVRSADGRRGVIRIKRYVRSGAQSYVVADVKMEKRADE